MPKQGEKFSAKIDRISSSGNGIIETSSGHINLGPVAPDSVGEEIKAEMMVGLFARCETKEVRTNNYNTKFEELVGSSPTKQSGANDKSFRVGGSPDISISGESDVKFCDQCGSVMYSDESMWRCRSCGFEKERDTQPNEPIDNKQKHGSNEKLDQPNPNKNQQKEDSTTEVEHNTTDSIRADRDLNELRERAENASVQEVPENATATSQTKPQYSRSQEVKEYVKARADGVCEGCEKPAPFINKSGEPYFHIHHIFELSDGGSDTPETVIALCPNCHYRVHHGKDGEEYNRELLDKVRRMENS